MKNFQRLSNLTIVFKFAITVSVYFEYFDVLTRPVNLKELNLSVEEIENVLDLISLLATKHKVYYLLRPNMIDEKDNIFMECAFVSESDYLVSSNIKDFRNSKLKGFLFQPVTPGDFLRIWREKNE